MKILLFVVSSVGLGAVLAPWIYNVGMALAEVTATKQTNALFDWLGSAAERSRDNFPRFFDRALLLSAVLLLGPFVLWLRQGRGGASYRDTPWSLRRPDAGVSHRGQPLQRNTRGWHQLGWGFALAAATLLLGGWGLTEAGFFMWRDAPSPDVANLRREEIDWSGLLLGAAPTAITVAVLEEILFRGVLLGIFLRAVHRIPALIGISFIFAAVHFLEPPAGRQVADPEAWDAGFELLGQIGSRFTHPRPILSRFSLLFAVGLVLALARYRTASLWLPVGLHSGWIFSYSVFKDATWARPGLAETWVAGGTLLEGLVPLLAVLGAGGVMMFLTRTDSRSPARVPHEAAG